MKYNFSDLVDITKLNKLMHNLYLATGIPSGIIDVNGKILVANGWQDICKEFHRKNFHMEKRCQQSDDYFKQNLTNSSPYLSYKCLNGLIEAGAPIIIDGEYLASLIIGQFFFEKPDISYFECQAQHYALDKEAYLAALAKVPIYTPEKIDSIMHYFIDIAEMLTDLGIAHLRQIEQQAQELQRNDEQIYRIFNSTPGVAIQGYDECGTITFWNYASEQMYGFTEKDVIEKPVNQTIYDDKSAVLLLDIIKEINLTNFLYGPVEWNIKHKDGTDKYVYSTLFPIILSAGKKEFICVDVDITEQKHLTRELERLDRMNLIGQMAASLGHEIRNPMTTVRGYLQVLRNKSYYPDHISQFDLMIEELDRANHIITEYLSLANNKLVTKKPSDVNQIINDLMPLIYAEAVNENKVIQWEQGDIEELLLDEKEIRQLSINLLRNALEAIEQGGTIRISTFMDNGEVILKIQDTGKGIPKELLDKVGTPFLTTKANGTGLGLAICFSIAARHNAKIFVLSDSSGTSILVKFMLVNND